MTAFRGVHMLACDSPGKTRSWDPEAPGGETERLMREVGDSECFLTVNQGLLLRAVTR